MGVAPLPTARRLLAKAGQEIERLERLEYLQERAQKEFEHARTELHRINASLYQARSEHVRWSEVVKQSKSKESA